MLGPSAPEVLLCWMMVLIEWNVSRAVDMSLAEWCHHFSAVALHWPTTPGGPAFTYDNRLLQVLPRANVVSSKTDFQSTSDAHCGLSTYQTSN